MDRMRATNRIRARLRQTKETHFALANELGHGVDRFFNRCIGIDSMLIIEIDHVDIEPAKTTFARLAHVIRLSTDSTKLRFLRISQDSKFRGDDNLFAMTLQRAA